MGTAKSRRFVARAMAGFTRSKRTRASAEFCGAWILAARSARQFSLTWMEMGKLKSLFRPRMANSTVWEGPKSGEEQVPISNFSFLFFFHLRFHGFRFVISNQLILTVGMRF